MLDQIEDKTTASDAMPAEQLKQVSKLLLNAWSAEYALHITPIINDRQYMENCALWTYPQAYYAALFSFRAYLLTSDVCACTEDSVIEHADALVRDGFYGTSSQNLLLILRQYKVSSDNKPVDVPPHLALLIHELLEIVTAQALQAHEQLIYRAIGYDAYAAIIDGLPDYLRTGRAYDRLMSFQKS